jgi:hypothetical protein
LGLSHTDLIADAADAFGVSTDGDAMGSPAS